MNIKLFQLPLSESSSRRSCNRFHTITSFQNKSSPFHDRRRFAPTYRHDDLFRAPMEAESATQQSRFYRAHCSSEKKMSQISARNDKFPRAILAGVSFCCILMREMKN